ncbi:MAG: hypothetical protein MUF31_04340 [Akkermansiaceae bacterium]|jgi:hypothetical protein|nr:hypothetical protein [Akkermansiaceae bacterium]
MPEPTTPDESALEDAYNDVLRKIGRNLVCFQMAEQILKEIAKLIGTTISMDNAAESLANEQKRVAKMTLGSLSTRFTDIYLLGKEPNPPATPERLGKGGMILTVSIENDPETLAKRRESLEFLVNERNWLVHHLLDGFDRDCLQACREMAERLDLQREAILPEIEELRSDYLNIHESRRMLRAQIIKPENRARFLAHLNS